MSTTPSPKTWLRCASPLTRVALSLLCASVLSAAARPAQADTPVVLKLMLNGFAADPRMDSVAVSTGAWVDAPDPVKDKNVRLHADGPLVGAGFRATLAVARTRLSLGMNVFGVDNATFRHDPIAPADLYTRTGLVWGENIDLALGREFRLGPVFPYLDLRLCVDLIAASLELHSRQYGLLGSTGYTDVSFGMGPMAGVFVPLDDSFFVDLAGYGGLIGVERFAGFASVGVWIDGDHL